jgi:hypothetical protein
LSEAFEEYSITYSKKNTDVMVYSSNVAGKNKGYDILLDVLRRTQELWYTPRMSQKKTRGNIYSSMFSEEQYIIPLFFSETFEEYMIPLFLSATFVEYTTTLAVV